MNNRSLRSHLEKPASRFIVDLQLSYTVEAETPDSALRAVIPMAGNAETASYTVQQATLKAVVPPEAPFEHYAHLTKAVYKCRDQRSPKVASGCRRRRNQNTRSSKVTGSPYRLWLTTTKLQPLPSNQSSKNGTFLPSVA